MNAVANRVGMLRFLVLPVSMNHHVVVVGCAWTDPRSHLGPRLRAHRTCPCRYRRLCVQARPEKPARTRLG